MATVISFLLAIGVGLSALLLIAGVVLLLITGTTGYGHEPLTPPLLLSPENTGVFSQSIGDVLRGILTHKPFAVIEVGVLLLIATPVFRVAASIVLFLMERDFLYTLITLWVLIFLLISLFWIG